MAYPSPSPLLLARRLSTFLHDSLEARQHDPEQPQPALQSALVLSPTGKLLVYASPLPVRTLRTHCSVAASLWALHAASSPAVGVALGRAAPTPTPTPISPPLHGAFGEGGGTPPKVDPEQPYDDGSAPVSIAASFNGGAIFVVRRLRCGLLFACSVPSPYRHDRHNNSGRASSRPVSSSAPTGTATAVTSTAVTSTAASPTSPPSAIAPITSAATPAASMMQSSLLPQSALRIPRLSPPEETTTTTTATTLPSSSSLHAASPPLTDSAATPAGTATPTPIPVRSSLRSPSADAAGSSNAAHGTTASGTGETYKPAPSAGPEDTNAAAVSTRRATVEAGDPSDPNADAASITTTATATTVGGGSSSNKSAAAAATLAVVRRQVDELAVLLDEKLGVLEVPKDSIGDNGFCWN
ncbi:hypothetical protein SPI_05613 [Niveomyces insectorum RCEF 264]|uniref:Uncharacterized protein n=1 Tax=Niveomyces insectorum RCEF 264 TaxID=1081102 RepID=A0A167TDF3_9HYPO|nr:hypothetical protein SPI_05613 [Niveomyces insectorum RCEF 264]